MQFDYIIGNPPYGATRTKNLNLHYDITNRLLNKFNEKMIFIMPHRVVYSTSDRYNKFKITFNKKLQEVSEINSSVFEGTHMANVGLFEFINNKSDKIKINLLNKKLEINTLFDISPFSEYEKKFIFPFFTKEFENKVDFRNINKLVNLKSEFIICTSMANGSLNGRWFSNKLEKLPIMTKEQAIKYQQEDKRCKWFLGFNTIQEASNFKMALLRPLLRFILHKVQDDQNIKGRCYKNFPNINWNDQKCLSDEGILELCGFSIEKSKEFANYCEDYIKKIDNKI